MNFTQFLNDFVSEIAKQMQLGIVAEIKNFDSKKMRADVQPIMKTKNLSGTVQVYPIIPNVPVQMIYAGGYYIRPVYKSGDMVWLTFATFDIANALNAVSEVESTKVFTLESCSVTGAVTPTKFTAPAEFGSEPGLIIGHESGNAFMSCGEDNITFKFGNGQEVIKMSATGIETMKDIKAGGEVTVNGLTLPLTISQHTHLAGTALISTAPGSPVTGVTGTPTPGT